MGLFFKKRSPRIAIIDDLYPHPLSRGTWRGAEFEAYLKHFPNLKIYSNLFSKHLIDALSAEEIFATYRESAPTQWTSRVNFVASFDIKIAPPDLFYFLFLNNTYLSLPTINRYKKPFVFTLYPGGGFALHDAESDQKLRAVTSNPYFRGVLATSTVTQNYLIEKGFCREQQIFSRWGCVFNEQCLQTENYSKLRYGFEKPMLDVAFVANRYTEHGEDKGYDIFLEVAKKLVGRNVPAKFHVVGNFSSSTLEITPLLKENLKFYGTQHLSFFDSFYHDKDLIISPNRPDVLSSGAFDGFPTASVVDAIIRKTAAFCTDLVESGQNSQQYEEGKEIEIIAADADEILDLTLTYYREPEKLKILGEAGAIKARSLYSFSCQIEPRILWLEKILEQRN